MLKFFGGAVKSQSRRRKIGTDNPVVKGIVSPRAVIPTSVLPQSAYPEYAVNGVPHNCSPLDKPLYNPNEYQKLRDAGRLARKMLDFANSLVKPGVTTDYIDSLVFEEILKHGAYPSPLNYSSFPKSICTSPNEVVCHGIPDSRVLEEGDIISIDVSVYLNGYHGDNCGTVLVGEKGHRDIDKRLIDATQESLEEAIKLCKPGACFSDVGNRIQNVAAAYGFNVVREFCGHGTGRYLHIPPMVLHYCNTHKMPILKGMAFTIEPILVEGSRHIQLWDDGWTATTDDGGRAAQFEHEILIHDIGAEILTVSE